MTASGWTRTRVARAAARRPLHRWLGTPIMALLLIAAMTRSEAATFVVTTTSDIGDGTCVGECTLREAILAANGGPGADTIHFAIQLPTRGTLLIQPTSPLPTITAPVTIDGYSQRGTQENDDAEASNAKLRIRLDGALANTAARGLSVCASNVTIRGIALTGFAQGGLAYGTQSTGNPCPAATSGGVIAGNFVGLSTDGSTAAGNTGGNINIGNAVVRIGGSAPADRNLVAAASGNGISFSGSVAGSRVESNLIGTDRSGTLDRGNSGSGINFDPGSSGLVVGSTGNGNLIAYNGFGIRTFGGNGVGLTFFANAITSNDDLGIDLGSDGSPTANDANDVDVGANGLQNFPVISDATRNASGVTTRMFLDVGHSDTRNYRIALYAGTSCDASGHGEGERLIAVQLRGLRASSETFDLSALTEPLAPGTVLTATATAPDGSTSEFSECFPLDPPPLIVNTTADTGTGTCDAAECTLREAITVANATPGTADTIWFAIPTPASGELTIAPVVPLPDIVAPLTIDGYTQADTSANTDPLVSNAILRVRIDGTGMASNVTGLTVCADNVTIRGLSLTGFALAAIRYGGGTNGPCAATTSGGLIAGNFIGLATDGVTAAGNGNGLLLSKVSVRIGDGTPAGRNVISASTEGSAGIVVSSAAFPDVQGNLIGTDRSGQLDRGNARAGILFGSGAAGAVVGSATSPNLFAFNETGIRTLPGAGAGNTWAQNLFRDNDELGIDIFDAGVNANDPDDADALNVGGAQNFPELTQALRAGAGLRLAGRLDVPANQTGDYLVSVYANASCDGSGHGEGERPIGSFVLPVVDGSGEDFDAELISDDPLPVGTVISAIATAPNGSSSEFSACLAVTDPTQSLIVNAADDSSDGSCDPAHCSLREAIGAANTRAGADTIAFALTGIGPHRIAPATELPAITDAVVIDGYTQLGAVANIDPVNSNAVIQVWIDGTAALVAGLRVCADDVLIRGVSITRFDFAIGINLLNCGGSGIRTVVQGAFIGLAPDGTAPPGQTGTGVIVSGASVQLGGEDRTERNVIAGRGQGLSLSSSSGSLVLGNLFGTDPDGVRDRANQTAALLINTSTDNVFGSAVAPNRFAFNVVGIAVVPGSRGNRLFANEYAASLISAIDLRDVSGSGTTPNDVNDGDAGGNDLQNFPVLLSAEAQANSFVINGTLDVPGATFNAPYTIALYESESCGGSGQGHGEVFLGAQIVSLSGSAESFSVDVPVSPPAPGRVITATATDPQGNTSEFSACLASPVSTTLFADGFES